MATPTDLQTSINSVQWTNGRGLIAGSTLLGIFSVILTIISSLGTWDSSGNFTPNIAAGSVTASMLAPDVAANILGTTGVTAGTYGAAGQTIITTVGSDGRVVDLSAQNIVITPTQAGALPIIGGALTGPLGLPAYTVAALPACNTASRDQVAVISDAASPTYRGTPAGGGTTRTLVECDGASWTTH